jgi:hypothetical protein
MVDKKVTTLYSRTLSSISTKSQLLENQAALRPQVIKNVLITTFIMVNNKFRKVKEDAFREIWKR